jgi:hypothetical protein
MRFSLRDLFWFFLVISFALGLFVQHRRHVAQRHEQEELIAQLNLEVTFLNAPGQSFAVLSGGSLESAIDILARERGIPISVDWQTFKSRGIGKYRDFSLGGTSEPDSLGGQLERLIGCDLEYRATPTTIIISAAGKDPAGKPVGLQPLESLRFD